MEDFQTVPTLTVKNKKSLLEVRCDRISERHVIFLVVYMHLIFYHTLEHRSTLMRVTCP